MKKDGWMDGICSGNISLQGGRGKEGSAILNNQNAVLDTRTAQQKRDE